MNSQYRTSGVNGSHGKTIEEPSLVEKGKGKIGASGQKEPSLLIKGKGKLGTSGEAKEEMDVNIAKVMDIQDSIVVVEGSDGIKLIEEVYRKMMSKRGSKSPEADNSEDPEVTIFRASLDVENSKKSMFEPSKVSIGPYHWGHDRLREMEAKKWSFLEDLLCREGCTLKDCIKKIADQVKKARSCYSEPFEMSIADFAQMLVLDGCFIVEFFYKYFIKRDPRAISEGWVPLIIEKDLILLENQIPFFIIQTLEGFLKKPLNWDSIAKLLTWQLIRIPIGKYIPEEKTIYHLLHLCHCYAVPVPQQMHSYLNWIRVVPIMGNFFLEKEKKSMQDEIILRMTIPCATHLEEAGVKFKKAKKSNELTKITFHSGTLEIPPLHITNGLKSLIMNLVSLEQCMSLLPSHFSTYILFMDKLVNTTHDVKILQQKGILDNMLSSEEETAHFLNQTGHSVQIPPHNYLAEVFKKVNKYCNSSYHKHQARLCHDYFDSPWKIISLIAGTVLLLLTFAQTFMAVYSYILPPS